MTRLLLVILTVLPAAALPTCFRPTPYLNKVDSPFDLSDHVEFGVIALATTTTSGTARDASSRRARATTSAGRHR